MRSPWKPGSTEKLKTYSTDAVQVFHQTETWCTEGLVNKKLHPKKKKKKNQRSSYIYGKIIRFWVMTEICTSIHCQQSHL